MTKATGKRRGRGDDAVYWDKSKNRWVGALSLGTNGEGKRIRPKVTGKTKAEALANLRELRREYDDGVVLKRKPYSVEQCVRDWLDQGLKGRSENTIDNYRTLAEKHIVPSLGGHKLRDLTARHVADWLDVKAGELSTRTLRLVHELLTRSIRAAVARDQVKRNVSEMIDTPPGQAGRPSRAMTVQEAEKLMSAAEGTRLEALVKLGVLMGLRPGELLALRWDHVDFEAGVLHVWRSTREGGDTKTEKSRRSLTMPLSVPAALRAHRKRQAAQRLQAGSAWVEHGLVVCTEIGTPADARNVRRDFAKLTEGAGLGRWHPHEMRHTTASVLSAHGLSLLEIADVLGHDGTRVTESVYRHVITPEIKAGATVMDAVFGREREAK